LRRVLVLAGAVAVLVTVAGLAVSFAADPPTNQTICATACALGVLAWLGKVGGGAGVARLSAR
jgi:ABC-type Mn2+/Zn2+ transport system permease subunit